MSRNNIPYVNASLMHELRMIATQFLRSKENMQFWDRHKPKKSATPPLVCVACIKEHRVSPKPAVTIQQGNAVCASHVI